MLARAVVAPMPPWRPDSWGSVLPLLLLTLLLLSTPSRGQGPDLRPGTLTGPDFSTHRPPAAQASGVAKLPLLRSLAPMAHAALLDVALPEMVLWSGGLTDLPVSSASGVAIHSQDHLFMDLHRDARLGGYFSQKATASLAPPADNAFWLVSSSSGPITFSVGTSSMTLRPFNSPPTTFDMSPARLIESAWSEERHAFHSFWQGPDEELLLCQAQGLVMECHPLALSPMSLMMPGRVGSRGHFFTWADSVLHLILPLAQSPKTSQLDLLSAIVDVAVLPQVSDGELVLVLLESREIAIIDRQLGDASIGQLRQRVALPAGGPEIGRLAAPRATVPGGPLTWALYIEGMDRLWRLDVDKGTAVWTRLELPPAVAEKSGLLSSLRLVRLRAGGARPDEWVLSDGQYVYLDSGAFHCEEDRSINCATSSLRPELGYGCQSGRRISPYLFPGSLCGACEVGMTVPALTWKPADRCNACPPKCQVCLGSQCLVCAQGSLLLTTDEATTCVDACTGDHVQAGARCMPRWPAATSQLTPMAWPPDDGLAPLDTVARSHLVMVGGEVHLVGRSQPAGAGALLGFRSTGAWMLEEASDRVSGVRLAALDFGPGTVLEYGEIPGGPGRHPSTRVAFVCSSTNELRSVEYRCLEGLDNAQQPCRADVGPVRTLLAGCQSLRVLDNGQVLSVIPSPRELVLFHMDSGGKLGRLDLPHTAGHAEFFPLHPWNEAPPREWLFRIAAPGVQGVIAGDGLLHPWELVRKQDSRVIHGQDQLPATQESLPLDSVPLVVPIPGRVAEFFVGALVAVGPNRAAWQVRHFPLGTRPHGSTVHMPGLSQVLAEVSSGPSRMLVIPLAGLAVRHPAAVVLVTAGQLGVALLECPPTGELACWLTGARLFDLEQSIPRPDRASVVLLRDQVSGLQLSPGVTFLLAGAETLLRVHVGPLACSPGEYGPECQPCDASCLTCSGPGSSRCTACRHFMPGAPDACLAACPVGLTGLPDSGECACHPTCLDCGLRPDAGPPAGGYRCLDCGAGFAPVAAGSDRCAACHPSCGRCSAPGDPAFCTSCTGGSLLHQGACVGTCPVGFGSDGTRCLPCEAGCASCPGGNGCGRCFDGHFLHSDGKCRPCDTSCGKCLSADACDTCQQGLVFLSPNPSVGSLCGSTCAPGEYVGPGRCMACDGSCALCTGGPAVCSVCAPGHRWAGPAPAPGSTGACVACPPSCLSCTASRCLDCEPGLFLTRGNACVGTCPAGTFADVASLTCQPCDVTCAECAGPGGAECTACGPGLEMIQSGDRVYTCVSTCGSQEYRDPVSLACAPCHGACSSCNGPTDRDCWRCADQEEVLQDGQCVQECAEGHVATSGRCLPCHPSCAECSGIRSTECLPDCPPELLALPAGAPAVRCVPSCPVGYNTSTAGCSPCGAHCSSCPGQADTCALCERGWLLASPACVDSCPAGSSPQGGLCATCHPTCDTCYGPGAGHCLACRTTTPLFMDGYCHADCPVGTFEDGGSCVPCHHTCAQCTGPHSSQCTSCPPARLLHGNACVLDCPAKFFPSSGRVCSACDADCAACATAGACTTCAQGAWLEAGRCVDSCSARFFLCPGTSSCEACPAGCSSCAAADAGCMPVCTGCEGALVLSPVTGLCAEACAEGEFLPSGQATCAPCDSHCRTCLGSGAFCTSCAGPSSWLQPESGLCVSACPGTGFVEAVFPGATPDRVCLACPDTCETCTTDGMAGACKLGPSGRAECPVPETCTRCESQLLLHGGSCVPACPSTGFFADWEASPAECAACHDKCRVCSGPSRADCLDGSGSSRGRLALGLGIGLGLLFVLLLLAVVVLLFLRHRRAPAAKKSPGEEDAHATVLNTIVELSLPGSIIVNIMADFSPLGEENLGAGTQASVYAARAVGAGISDRLKCPHTVAIKRLKADTLRPSQAPLFQNEVALMWMLRDAPNVVQLYGYSETPPAIVMERFQASLDTLLHSDVALSPVQLLDIVQQWATGLEAMHAHGVAHCDLKPGNVFVALRADGGWAASLGDLGTSRNLSTDRSSALVNQPPELSALTARYAAPEVLAAFQRRRPLDTELYLPADIYSAAVLLWECLHRRVPWQGQGFEEIAAQVLAGDRPDAGGSVPLAADPLADMLPLAWDSNPHSRPMAASFRLKCSMAWLAAGGD